ncbi:SWIM zinc finger family protein [Sphaerisporangium dianthi]|uniref:SWIM zinc finger family protein n=1 Tax=Sphaerisporangium dianthi TaxID=1436120 RepID=A0ABV9CP52_9ACTN
MTSATQAYTYAAPSSLVDGRLGLATSGGRALSGRPWRPRFFRGEVTQAAPVAAALLGVADVVLARDHQSQARPGWVRDLVVTCNGDRLRFESFSACGGVYARLDLLNGALDGEVFDRGTTNVNVNAPLREALARIGARDPLHLGVGLDELVVTTMDGAVVEKKVPLPERWLRGFAEVQVIASGMDQRGELTGMAAVRFLRGLPKKGTVWVTQSGRDLKVADRRLPGAVQFAGPHPLGTLLPLLRFAKSLRVYGPADAASSAWELELPGMRYTLTLSPERWRGFSDGGAVLDDLATDEAGNDADVVGILLNFEPEVEIGLLADRAGIPADRVRAALTQLGVVGRAGYDLAEAAHFHRELPYDKDNVVLLNPRLAKARRLVDAGAFHLEGESATVHTSGGARRVSLAHGSCTCEWWWDHRGSHRPCEHVLAARIVARAAVEVSR